MREVMALAALALMLGASPAAWAASEAVLARPVGKQRIIVLDGKVWTCREQRCTAAANGVDQPARRECVRARRRLGALTAYARNGVALDAAQLAACNGHRRSRGAAS